MTTKQNKSIINGITYRAIIRDLPITKKIIYNFGTESRPNTRTAEHARIVKKRCGATYEVISEIADRVVGGKLISPSQDAAYIKYLCNYINARSPEQVKILNDSDIDLDVSVTECLLLSEKLYKSDLFKKAIEAADKWYYNDRSIRVPLKYSNASSVSYFKMSADEKKKVCHPIVWNFHSKIISELQGYKNKKDVQRALIQSLSLAADYNLLRQFPKMKEIVVLAVADDILKNEELYQKMCADPLYNIIELDNDSAIEDHYMNACKNFDLIIGNPPYNNSLHATILSTVVENNPDAIIAWLAPTNLVTGKQPPVLEAHNLLKDKFTGWDYVGTQFGEEVIVTPIAIYYFSSKSSLTWEDAHTQLRTLTLPSYKSIKEKIVNAPKVNRINKTDKKRDFRTAGKGTRAENWNNLIKVFPNGVLPPHSLFYWDTGALYRKNAPFASEKLDESTMGMNGYLCQFNSAEECEEQKNKLNDPRYRWILYVLSPNNRDLLCKPEDLPESFDACGFTDEEIKELQEVVK